MKQSLVHFLKSLPGAMEDGTVLRYLFDGDKMQISETELLRRLVVDLVDNKRGLEKENQKMAEILKSNNLYYKLLGE